MSCQSACPAVYLYVPRCPSAAWTFLVSIPALVADAGGAGIGVADDSGWLRANHPSDWRPLKG
jgi:hypothetical protein